MPTVHWIGVAPVPGGAESVVPGEDCREGESYVGDHEVLVLDPFGQALHELLVEGKAALEALETSRPKRGRKRTREAVERRLESVDQELEAADPLARLHLLQERQDLEAELQSMNGVSVDLASLEEAFVQAAAPYSRWRGISYSAWRAVGVPPAVLGRTGIGRGQ